MADTRIDVYCPACGRRMNKIYIAHLKINVDICDESCGGIFFDNREFEKFDEDHENADEILKLYENKNFTSRSDDEVRVCPSCKTRMVKHGSGTAQNKFKIDVCYSCGAKFLDGYELQQIRSAKTTKEENENFLKQVFEKVVQEAAFKEANNQSNDENKSLSCNNKQL